MLIEDEKLNIEEFKSMFDSFDWIKAPRKLTKKITEYFYIGKYEDSDKIIRVTIRPSMRMQIIETFKNRHPRTGAPVKEDYKGETVQFGSCVETLITENLLDKIKKEAVTNKKKTIQTIDW